MQHMHQEPIMIDPSLQNELKPNEQLLWWGRPDPARMVKNTNTQMATVIVFGLLLLVAIGLIFNNLRLIFEEISFFGQADSNSYFLLFISFLLLCVPSYRLYLLYSQTQKRINDLRQTIYGITSQRVIVMTASKQSFAVNSYTHNDIGQINRIETGGGWGDVAYGKVRQIQRGTRTITITEKLVGIPNAHMVEDILSRTFQNRGQFVPQTPMQAQQYEHPPMLLHYEQPPQGGYPPQVLTQSQQYPPTPRQYERPPQE